MEKLIAARFEPRWLRHYAASKLRRDPIFSAAYDLLGTSTEPLLDIGCGVGLLPAYLRACGYRQPVKGVDVDARKIRHALNGDGIDLEVRDASEALPEFSGNVALIDVLHYLPPSAQKELLGQIAGRISQRGLLLLRDGIRDGSPRYWMTYAGEVFAQTLSWSIGRQLHFPTRKLITQSFPPNEFSIEDRPMYRGTPFNNWLFVVRRVSAAVPGAE